MGDDFIAAAEFLITEERTTRDILAIQGGSNGDLLVTAVANQRPELFRTVVAQVPVTDMVRYHKFTIGHAWAPEYGHPDDPDALEVLLKYSPLHSIPENPGYFPATLVLTADRDDRVVPLHSLKYHAEL